MVDREELIRRAAGLVPVLRERAGLTEELRQIPQETVDDFHGSGILRAAQPTRFGGYTSIIQWCWTLLPSWDGVAAPQLGVTGFRLPTTGPQACSRRKLRRSIGPNRWTYCRPRR